MEVNRSLRSLSIIQKTEIVEGITVFIVFPIWEIYSSDNISKLCPPSVFRNIRGFAVPLAAEFVSGMLVWCPHDNPIELSTFSDSSLSSSAFRFGGHRVRMTKSNVKSNSQLINLFLEVQLLFTNTPSKIGWYSFAYNGPATSKCSRYVRCQA